MQSACTMCIRNSGYKRSLVPVHGICALAPQAGRLVPARPSAPLPQGPPNSRSAKQISPSPPNGPSMRCLACCHAPSFCLDAGFLMARVWLRC
ncbi:hypothetical protein CI102_13902 [Trichoderma harzianum]|nr:hypothetical protein CI102_13902 [Trichoderma harzianum]